MCLEAHLEAIELGINSIVVCCVWRARCTEAIEPLNGHCSYFDDNLVKVWGPFKRCCKENDFFQRMQRQSFVPLWISLAFSATFMNFLCFALIPSFFIHVLFFLILNRSLFMGKTIINWIKCQNSLKNSELTLLHCQITNIFNYCSLFCFFSV